MIKVFVLCSYLGAMWSNLIVPCVTNPNNWKYCMNDWDQWMYPEIHRAWEIMSEQEKPYQEEQTVLQSRDES